MSGDTIFALAHLEPGGTWESRVETTARECKGQVVLHGTKTTVLAGDCADRLLVTGRTEQGDLGAYLVHASDPGVRRHPYRGHDGVGGATVELEGAAGVRLGLDDAEQAVREAVIIGRLALCAEAVGALEQCLELTVEHLKSRTQFGTTLGSFQALAHRAADLYVAVQTARALTLHATTSHDAGTRDAVLAARAKLQVGRSAHLVGQEVIQMHGAIGMTAEHPVSHYVKRLLAIERTFGSTDDQLRMLADRVKTYDNVDA